MLVMVADTQITTFIAASHISLPIRRVVGAEQWRLVGRFVLL